MVRITLVAAGAVEAHWMAAITKDLDPALPDEAIGSVGRPKAARPACTGLIGGDGEEADGDAHGDE